MIEQEIVQAIRDKKDFSTPKVQDMYREKEGRRDVLRWSDMDNFVYELWGHTIAKGDSVMKILLVSDCGYPTATTKSRLNAIFAGLDIPMSCSIRNEKTVFYLGGQEIKVNTHNQHMSVICGEWQITVTGLIL
jgi:hypothetical protein